MAKRTNEEKLGAFTAIQLLKQHKNWATYEKEVLRIKMAIADGAYRDTGEALAKTVGIIKGINIALGIDDMIKPAANQQI